jgi:stress response protein YsnF
MSSELPPSGEPHIPLHAEDLTVSKLQVAGDIVRVRTITREQETFVDETLNHERVQIERV